TPPFHPPLVIWFAPNQGGDHVATTPDELDALLNRIASHLYKTGIVAEITREGDDDTTLYAGFRGEVGALRYNDDKALHYSSNEGNAVVTGPRGQGEAHTMTVLRYRYQDNEMELPPDAEIPVADVRAAVHQYARTGTRPTTCRWQQWKAPRTPGSDMPDPLDADVWG
ncbi:Imm1 family immunity protein, partial [Actinokineospora sp. NPDC004072]